MAWYEDQPFVTEGFDNVTMMNVLQVWLPIQFHTNTVHPVHEQKLFAELSAAQKQQLVEPNSEVVVATHTLTAANRDVLRGELETYGGAGAGYFVSAVGIGMKIGLPAGWLASAATMAVKTLVGYLLRQAATTEKASFLAANLAVGGELRECWHTVGAGGGNTFLHRVMQYEVKVGAEKRQFVICSTRYALKP